MSDLYEPDVGTAFYRSNDPIKNIKICVKLNRAAVANIIPQAQLEEEKGGHVNIKDLKERLKHSVGSADTEEYVFGWQEKVFSKREYETFLKEERCVTVLEKKYHSDCKKLEENKGRPNRRLFSYVSHDVFTNRDDNAKRFTNHPDEQETLMAEKMANLRFRRNAPLRNRGGENAVIPKSNIIEYEPSEDLKKQNHYLSGSSQTMYIMADLNPTGKDYSLENEAVLCTVKLDSNGVLSVKPDFNKGRKAYRAECGATGRELFEYTIDHVSKELTWKEKDKESKMFKELYLRHSEYLASLVGHEFEMPPIDMMRLLVYGEVESCKNFEYDDLFVQYFVELPEGWYPMGPQQLSGVTQTCRTKTLGREQVSYFSYPFSFELVYQRDPLLERNKDHVPKWPQLLFEVQSIDSWQRYRVEGYGYMTLPMKAGVSNIEVNCWRPRGNSTMSEVRRFFIGGSPELEDLTYTARPSTFEGKHLSKFGFRTITTGSVSFRMNCIQQSQAFLHSAASKKKVGTVMDRIGFSAAQANIMSVIEAFQKAKQRMIAAREHLHLDYIETLRANEVDEDAFDG